MINSIYKALDSIGYNHPIHPPVTHIPVGLVIGAFIFIVASLIFNRESFAQTARHCIVLAFFFTPVAIFLGLMDWQHFYGGALLVPIQIKLFLAVSLIFLLLIALRASTKRKVAFGRILAVYGLCLCVVVALGFLGGELVYGTKKPLNGPDSSLVQGVKIFNERCQMCHYSDSLEIKIGPGLKGLFQRSQMPISKQPVSAEAISNQLKTPFEKMPAFPDFTEDQTQSLVAYLKTF